MWYVATSVCEGVGAQKFPALLKYLFKIFVQV